MNHDFFNYIRALSDFENKPVTNRALKTAEEVGELARAVLLHEGGAKEQTPEKILDEVADTVLGALSTAFAMGFSSEDVMLMLMQKAEKWALDIYKHNAQFPVPFELIHTFGVEIPQASTGHFFHACAVTNSHIDDDVYAALTLKLNSPDEGGYTVAKTHSYHFGNNVSAYDELSRIRRTFVDSGFTPTCSELRAVLWHPAAPKGDEQMPEHCRFEADIRLITTNEIELKRLHDVLRMRLPVFPKLVYKISDTEHVTKVTYVAANCNSSTFRQRCASEIEFLTNAGFSAKLERSNFVIFNSDLTNEISYLIGLQ